MKTYIAARFDKKPEVLEIYRRVRELGHEIAADWTTHKAIKPYEEHEELAKEYAIEDVAAAMDCDVFIILSSDAGTGMYVELGAAVASHLLRGKPQVYVVGDHRTRAMFYYHPSVRRRGTIEEVLNELRHG